MSDKVASKLFGALLAIIFLLALGAIRSSWTERKAVGVEAEQKAAQRIDDQENDRHLTPDMADREPSTKRNGEAEKDNTNENASEFWAPIFGYRIKVTDSLLVLCTAILAWKTAGLDKATRKLWEAGERQIELTRKSAEAAVKSADSAVASNRAWLKLDVGEDVRTIINNEVLCANFSIVITKTGACPATRIFLIIVPFFDSFSNNNFIKWAVDKGEEIRTYSISQGPTLFPNETDERNWGLNGKMDDIQDSVKFASRFDGAPGFIFRALICVSYLSLPDTKVHITRKLFTMSGKQGGRINVQDIDDVFGVLLRADNHFGPGDHAD